MAVKTTFKSGFVAIVGRPNSGKSTLLNSLLNTKVSIVSPVPQTTRYRIRGILNFPDAQIVFIDTPGIHSIKGSLVGKLNEVALNALDDIDLVLYVADVSRKTGKEESSVMQAILASKAKVIMVLNKIDKGPLYLNQHINAWKEFLAAKKISEDPVRYYIPVSAMNNVNLGSLKDAILELLPNEPALYEAGTLTDLPLKFRIADIIREKLFLSLKEELPHHLAVVIEEMEDRKKIYYIRGKIYINRPSQKSIVIGKGARLIKEVNTQARKDLENILKKKVFLETFVQVLEGWENKPQVLAELGYAA